MRASELIRELQEIITARGDVGVTVETPDGTYINREPLFIETTDDGEARIVIED